jgi:hypothetical protein
MIDKEIKKFWKELIAYFPCYDMDRTEEDGSNNSIVARIFVAVVTFLPSCCLETIGIHIQTQRLMGGIYELRR